MSAPPSIRELTSRYREDREEFKSGKLPERVLMQAYIEPLLGALGWGPGHLVREGMRSPGRFHFDYLVACGEERWLGVEVKVPRVRLKDAQELVERLRQAAWEAGLTYLVLTNFEELVCYTCEQQPRSGDSTSEARMFYLKFEEFEVAWDLIESHLSRAALDPSIPPDSLGEEESSDESEGDEEEHAWVGISSVDDPLLDNVAHVSRLDWSLRPLHHKWVQEELYIPLGLERGLVWPQDEQSRLIESTLLRIPLPAFFLAEADDGRLTVIDGQQRFLTLFRFIENKLELRGLRLLSSLNGLKFQGLGRRLQRRIEDTVLTTFLIHPGADPTIKFEIALRLNPTWSFQEVRRVIYQGPGLEMIRELSKRDGIFRRLVQRRFVRDSEAEELVLRMLAFVHLGPDSYTGNLPEFLTGMLEHLNRASSSERESLRDRVLNALKIVERIFDATPFRRFEPAKKAFLSVFNVALMEVMPWGFVVEPRGKGFWFARADRLREAAIELQSDVRFAESITGAVSSRSRVFMRFKLWREMLQHVANSDA